MVFQYDTPLILMICQLKEQGKPKCEKYWPDPDVERVYPEFSISQLSEKEVLPNLVERVFAMKDS